MTHNLENSHNFSQNASYVESLIPNMDTEQNQQQHIRSARQQQHHSSPQQKESPISSSQKNFSKHHSLPKSRKSAFELELIELESKLFHQVVLKSELTSQSELERQVVRKLSESVKATLQDNLNDIQKTQERLDNPLLNYFQKLQIQQALLQLRMEQLANTKVLVNTYRHHQYRLVFALLHISQIYLQLKCYQQAMNHLQNAITINDAYRHVSKGILFVDNFIDVQYFHALLLSFLALAQYEVQNVNSSLQNLNRALQIYETLKNTNHYECHDFFSLNLISKVLLTAGKRHQAISFGKMALQSAEKDYSLESVEYATGCKTLAQALTSQNQFDSAIQHIHTAIQTLQVHHPSKEQTIIQFYEKLTEITLKKLNTMKPEQPSPNYFDPYLQVVKKKYDVIQNTYGYRDKRVIKEKRHLASSLLKYGKVHQAQEELQDILEIQEVVYGEKSVEVAKTLKLLGTVAMSLNQSAKAEKHLKKSMGIFHDQGQVNLEKEVQAKLMILTGKGKFLLNNNSSKM